MLQVEEQKKKDLDLLMNRYNHIKPQIEDQDEDHEDDYVDNDEENMDTNVQQPQDTKENKVILISLICLYCYLVLEKKPYLPSNIKKV